MRKRKEKIKYEKRRNNEERKSGDRATRNFRFCSVFQLPLSINFIIYRVRRFFHAIVHIIREQCSHVRTLGTYCSFVERCSRENSIVNFSTFNGILYIFFFFFLFHRALQHPLLKLVQRPCRQSRAVFYTNNKIICFDFPLL